MTFRWPPRRARGRAVPAADTPSAAGGSAAGRLLRSGLFDEEYYAAAAGETFPTPLKAAEHCVRVGLPRRLSPNPLLEAAYLPARVQASWTEAKIGPTLAYLRSDRGRGAMLGPLFDAGQVPEPDGGFGRGGALSCFLASASEDTRLPLPDSYSGSVLTYGEARRQLLTGVITKRLAKSGLMSTSEPYAVRRTMNRKARAALWPPALRWGIKLPSTLGPIGDLWGDTHYGESLAAALRALGQEVTVYRDGVHDSPLSYLDDVVVAIRGLRPIAPVPGCLNIVWVISHPEDVSPAELHGFDLVFGASTPWCQRMTDLLGREVHPLLQATDTRRRPDTSVPPGDGAEAVFVGGNQQGRHRKIVHDAMTAGVNLALFGPGWNGTVPDHVVRGAYVANSDLLRLYRSHGLVLADHWDDMAAGGFLANRLFDAVAAGARVVSDRVAGIPDIFQGAVQVYDSPAELRYLCSARGRSAFPDDLEMRRISDEIADQHSFGRRAEALIAAALRAHDVPVAAVAAAAGSTGAALLEHAADPASGAGWEPGRHRRDVDRPVLDHVAAHVEHLSLADTSN